MEKENKQSKLEKITKFSSKVLVEGGFYVFAAGTIAYFLSCGNNEVFNYGFNVSNCGASLCAIGLLSGKYK